MRYPYPTEVDVTTKAEKLAVLVLLSIPAMSGCGEKQTSGFFVGPITGTYQSQRPPVDSIAATAETIEVKQTDTLVNCTFDNVLSRPFGDNLEYDIYNGSLHVDNSDFDEPIVIFSTAGLLTDGVVEAQFDLIDAPMHAVVGLVLRAESRRTFLLLGVNSRGQYTAQQCRDGVWYPVMGLEPFNDSRLLPYSLPGVELTAEVHGNYVDLTVNGQLVQVVRTALPPLGQVGVFVDAYSYAALDRFTVVPLQP